MKKHGMCRTRIYGIWCAMKARCYNPSQKRYEHYGAKGIQICQEWKDDFQCFWTWAQQNGYDDSLSIDRIDVNGNYEPSNCRWVSMKIQQNNRSNNHLITYKGETRSLAQWIELLHLKPTLILNRLNRGWSIEEAFETKIENKWRKGIANKQRQYKHGLSHTPTHQSWMYMRAICLNPNNQGYKNVGGKGINICSEWINDFQRFLDDMGERKKGYALARIDLNKDFCKENCKWVPHSEVKRRRG